MATTVADVMVAALKASGVRRAVPGRMTISSAWRAL
jgi:hypothetical protein